MKPHANHQLLIMLVLAIVTLVAGACNSGNQRPQSASSSSFPATPATTASPSSSMGDMSTGHFMRNSPNAAIAPYDLQFIDTMSEHHRSAIQMAKIAEAKAQHAELKALARNIVDSQQRELEQMKTWRDKWYPGKPEAINMDLPGMMESVMDMGKLNSATGAQFDLTFIAMMTSHHSGAVAMAKDAEARAEHPEIKQLARQIVNAQQKEIEQMNKWKAAWVGN